MEGLVSPFRRWLSGAVVRYLGIYLIYLATSLRLVATYSGRPEQSIVIPLLAVYGLLLVSEPLMRPSRRSWPWAYLLLQSAVVIGLQLVPPGEEVVSVLFVPLSLQAVLLLGRRPGLLLIAGFTLAIVEPVMSSWDWAPAGVAMVVFLGGVYLLMGHFAHLIRTAESARNENQRLIAEVIAANRQLRAYSAQVEGLAAARERNRLARELHDSATQTIFSMNLAVQTAHMVLEEDPVRAAEQLDRLQGLATRAAGEIGELVDRLRPYAAGPDGLPAALRRVIGEREAHDGLDINFEVRGDKELPEQTVAGLCRIAQEALNNVAKHAGTRQATVRLDLAGPRASLEVEDRGAGFSPGVASAKGEHLGLVGMAERANELGWKLICCSQPGHGTRIRVEEAE